MWNNALPRSRSLMLIYYALIYLSISFCPAVWGGASNESLKPLVTIQKRVVRVIGGLRARVHIANVVRSLIILESDDIITYINHCTATQSTLIISILIITIRISLVTTLRFTLDENPPPSPKAMSGTEMLPYITTFQLM